MSFVGGVVSRGIVQKNDEFECKKPGAIEEETAFAFQLMEPFEFGNEGD